MDSFTKKLRVFFSKSKNLYITYAVLVVIILGAAVAIGFSIIFGNNNQDDNQDKIPTKTEQQEIMSEVIRNNPAGVIKIPKKDSGSQAENTSSGGNIEVDKTPQIPPSDPNNPANDSPIPVPDITDVGPESDIESEIIAPNLNVYNYRYTQIDTTPGPAIGTCNNYDYYSQKKTMDFHEYFDESHSFYMSKETGKNEELKSYYLGKYGSDINEYYQYIGGSIAAKLIFKPYEDFDNSYRMTPEETTSYPDSYPASYPYSTIVEYFGWNAEITDVEIVGDKVYYDITTYYYSSCSNAMDDPPERKIINIYKVDADDFSIVEVKTFINEVLDTNLILTKVINSQREKVSYDEVSVFFEFEYDVRLHEVDYSNYTYDAQTEYENVTSYLTSLQTENTIVYPDLDKFDLSYLYGKDFPESVEGERYYYLREYYPNTIDGEARYNKLMDQHEKSPWLNLSFSDEETSHIYIEVYDKSRNPQTLIDKRVGYSYADEVKHSQDDIQLNGDTVTVQKTILTNYHNSPYPISYPGSYPESYPASYVSSYPGYYTYKYTTILLVFEYMDNVYLIQNFDTSDAFVVSQQYYSVETNYPFFLDILGPDIRATFEQYHHYCGN